MPRIPVVDVDDVARSLATQGSRRGLLRALGTGLLINFAARGYDAAAVAATRQRSRRRRKTSTRCQKLGTGCNSRKTCCKGTRCARGRCQCPTSKKRCGPKCVPKSRCCPATGDGCVDSSRPPCLTGLKLCGLLCIPESGCCHDRECGRECETGYCDRNTHTCRISQGRACGSNDSGRCNSAGVCAQSCEEHTDCPSLDDAAATSAEEFCREARCEYRACEIGTKRIGTLVREDLQSGKDCEVRICDPGERTRYSLSLDPDLMNATLPPHENDCLAWTCKYSSLPNSEPEPRAAGTPCGRDDIGFCDGHGACVGG